MIPKINTSYYGDNAKTFYGKVINVNDPLQLGRVQVRIHGIHTENEIDIPTKALPWALTILPTTEAGVSGIGLNPGLKPFSTVYGIFADGDNAQEPIVLGSVPNYQRDDLLRDTKFNFDITLPSPHDFRIPVNKPSFFEDPDKLLKGTTNLEKAWFWFRSTTGGQYSQIATAGILGNLWIESYATINDNDLNPAQEQVGGGPGFGVAQWEGSRKNELVERSKSIPFDTMYAQLSFITFELDTKSWLGKNLLVRAKTVDEASDVFMLKYERPKDKSLSKKKVRRNAARDILTALSKGN